MHKIAVVLALVVLSFGNVALIHPAPLNPTNQLTATPVTNLELTAQPATEPNQMSSQELIAAALRDGHIDYGTSLLYRAYALFGDVHLPAEFQGEGSENVDPTLIEEIAKPISLLSSDIQTKLHPFTVRPNDPESIFNKPTVSQSGANKAIPQEDDTRFCVHGWTSASSTTNNFKVWACRDKINSTQMGKLVLEIDNWWGPMTDFMGQPIPDKINAVDTGNTDQQIDFYVVDNLRPIIRNGNTQEITLPGSAFPTPAADGQVPNNRPHGESGYVLLDAALLDSANRDLLDEVIIHEFFHVLEFGYNAFQSLGSCDMGWIEEASARWAQTFFTPATATQFVHIPEFINVFQKTNYPLRKSAYDHVEYIWSYFMQQELGSASDGSPILRTWQAIAQASDCDGLFNALNSVLPFATNFHIFALRNLNWDFGGSRPTGILYDDMNSSFPIQKGASGHLDNNYMPHFTAANITLQPQPGGPSTLYFGDNPLPLQAKYYWFKVSSDDVHQIKFDFSGLQDLDVDAVYKIGDQWKMQNWTGVSEHDFCRDQPDEKIQEVILVVSNHEREGIDLNKFSVQSSSDSCVCNSTALNNPNGWIGHISFSAQGAGVIANSGLVGAQLNWNMARSADYTVKLTRHYRGPTSWYGVVVGGSGHASDTITPGTGNTSRETISRIGTGPLTTQNVIPDYGVGEQTEFLIDPTLCTFHIQSATSLAGGTTETLVYYVNSEASPTTETFSTSGAIATFDMENVPLITSGSVISGSKSIPVLGLAACVPVAICLDSLKLSPPNTPFPLVEILHFGTVTVSWSFTPIA